MSFFDPHNPAHHDWVLHRGFVGSVPAVCRPQRLTGASRVLSPCAPHPAHVHPCVVCPRGCVGERSACVFITLPNIILQVYFHQCTCNSPQESVLVTTHVPFHSTGTAGLSSCVAGVNATSTFFSALEADQRRCRRCSGPGASLLGPRVCVQQHRDGPETLPSGGCLPVSQSHQHQAFLYSCVPWSPRKTY